MSDPAPSLQSTITAIANSGGWSGAATFQSSSGSIPYIYEQYWQGNLQSNRGFKYLHPERIWVDNGSGYPDLFEGGTVVDGVAQTAQNPQIVKGYAANGTTSNYSFNNPYYDASWSPPSSGGGGGGTLGGIVYVQDAKIVNYAGQTGLRFEQRGYPVASYELTGTGFTSSWSVTNQSNNLQHHISNLSVGTYYLYQDSVLVATLKARLHVSCNFW